MVADGGIGQASNTSTLPVERVELLLPQQLCAPAEFLLQELV
jgi:hypothetical protein